MNPPSTTPDPGRALQIRERVADPAHVSSLIDAGLNPVLARIMAARGVTSPDALSADLAGMLAPDSMAGLQIAARLLAQAIEQQQTICVIGDYDCDGATASALTVSGLRLLGARVDYLVPNRFAHGYGLSPAVVREAATHPRLGKPDWLITVDNGIVSFDGVNCANELGMRVIITDHHLPASSLPAAAAIVNPNVPGCHFPSKHLAGVGVAFYLIVALRTCMRAQGRLPQPAPNLASLLDLLALGTVADLVKLDDNNRRLVRAGMLRMRSGKTRPGISALMRVAGCQASRLTVRDLGFGIAPRINAAGRLEDISAGIECLLASDDDHADQLAQVLDTINTERRRIETDMRAIAFSDIEPPAPQRMSVTATHQSWHEGVVGLIAGRLRERFHRPVVAFAPASGTRDELRGSGRSIPGVHLRDVFALIDSREAGLVTRFGGHAMAAGLSLPSAHYARFESAFERAVSDLAQADAMHRELLVDGPLEAQQITLELCRQLDEQIWGQGFAAPVFCNQFALVRQRLVGTGHMKADLKLQGKAFGAIFFGRSRPLPPSPVLAYRVEINEFRGLYEAQLVIEACANG